MPELVGRAREAELADRLRTTAADGSPRLLLLAGEAGIGKTYFARHLADRAASAGGLVLWGAGHEDLTVPYLPVATALRPLIPGDERLAALLFRPQAEAPTATGVTDLGRLELFHGVADRVLAEAAERLVVLVVDDLQWVDPASLDLVTHLLAAGIHPVAHAPVRLLLVATYRTPLAGDRVTRTLARLRREPGAVELRLGPLDEVEVNELLRHLGPAPPTSRLLHAVHHAAGGNPLLVGEVLRQGLDRGSFVLRRGAVHLARDGEPVRPVADLDAVVRDRLATLGEPLADVLRCAAFLGEGWTPDALAAVTGAEPAALADLLAAARADDLVVVTDGRYRFAHPQIRHVLFHEPRGAERQALHLRVADGLDRLGDPADVIAVARHLASAGTAADPARTYAAAVEAGARALAVGAWADAAAALDTALAHVPAGTPWQERADLLVRAVWATFHDFDGEAAERHGREAIALARANGDSARWGEALLGMARALITQPGDAGGEVDAEITAFLDAAPGVQPRVGAQLLGLRAEVAAAAGRLDDAAEAARGALAALEGCDDPAARYHVEFAVGLVALFALDLDAARAAFARAWDAALRVVDDPWPGMGVPGRLVMVEALAGDLGGVDARVAAGHARQRSYGGWAEHSLLSALASMLEAARGRFADAEQHARDAEVLLRRSGYPFTAAVLYPALAQLRLLVGDPGGAHDALESWRDLGGRATYRYEQAVDALVGGVASVRRAVAARAWPPLPGRLDLLSLAAASLQAEVGVALGDTTMAAAARPLLEEAYGRGVRLTIGWATSVARVLAEIALAERDWDAAGRWLVLAERDVAALPPESARVRLARGNLELDSPTGDHALGARLVTDAAERLDEIGAIGLLSSVRGLPGAAAGPRLRTIMFTDLVSSTELNVRAGDATFVEMIREHDALVRRRLRLHGGVPFKHTGDGVAAWFESAAEAIACAAALQDDLGRASAAHPEMPLLVRAGLAAGEPIGHAGDLFGLAVTAAARICDLADAGQVLVSDEVASLARGRGGRLRAAGRHRLKGFPEERELHEVVAGARVGAG